MNKATNIAITKGMQANLVNNPSIKSMAQKNSAKITNTRDTVLPSPMKFINLFCIELKFVILLKPCIRMRMPKPTRKINNAVFTAPAEYFDDNKLLIKCFLQLC